jgi:hypothetical protein
MSDKPVKKWQPKRADWRKGGENEGDAGKSGRMQEVEELTSDVHAKERAEGFTSKGVIFNVQNITYTCSVYLLKTKDAPVSLDCVIFFP